MDHILATQTAIKVMLDQWHILLSKVHVILQDNASNWKKAFDNTGVHSLACVAHVAARGQRRATVTAECERYCSKW